MPRVRRSSSRSCRLPLHGLLYCTSTNLRNRNIPRHSGEPCCTLIFRPSCLDICGSIRMAYFKPKSFRMLASVRFRGTRASIPHPTEGRPSMSSPGRFYSSPRKWDNHHTDNLLELLKWLDTPSDEDSQPLRKATSRSTHIDPSSRAPPVRENLGEGSRITFRTLRPHLITRDDLITLSPNCFYIAYTC